MMKRMLSLVLVLLLGVALLLPAGAANPGDLGRVIWMDNSTSVFEVYSGAHASGTALLRDEIWMHRASTNELVMLIQAGNWGGAQFNTLMLGERINERFFSYSAGSSSSGDQTGVFFYDTVLQRSITLPFMMRVVNVTNQRVYVRHMPESGTTVPSETFFFYIAELADGSVTLQQQTSSSSVWLLLVLAALVGLFWLLFGGL